MATITPKADFEIPVTLETGTPAQPGPHAIPAIPPPPSMVHGQTVHHFSNDGEVTVEFVVNGSPFKDANGNPKTVITSNDPPLVLTTPGTFTCRCFITPTGTTVQIGWDPLKSPQSGGDHVVR